MLRVLILAALAWCGASSVVAIETGHPATAVVETTAVCDGRAFAVRWSWDLVDRARPISAFDVTRDGQSAMDTEARSQILANINAMQRTGAHLASARVTCAPNGRSQVLLYFMETYYDPDSREILILRVNSDGRAEAPLLVHRSGGLVPVSEALDGES